MKKLLILALLWALPAFADPVNVWVALRDDAQGAIVTRLQCDRDEACVYSGPVTNRQAKVFAKMSDRGNVQKLFRVDRQGARDWTVWSLYFDEPVTVLQKIQVELDNLATNYPTQFRIAGAWHWDGRQVGTQWNVDRTDVIGTPTYPVPARLIEAMPDLDSIGTRPTQLTDINLLMGQVPRRFQ